MIDSDLINIARIGIDAEAFAKSDIGKFLIGKAQAEIENEIALLIDADPDDVKLGRDIRNRIVINQNFLTWLNEAINTGRHCHEQLQALDAIE
jgi:hypothetical protein